MDVARSLKQARRTLERLASPKRAIVGLTIGNFDGVHLGHQQLIAELTSRTQAKVADLKTEMPVSVLMSFCPYPQQVIRNISRRDSLAHDELFRISTTREKILRLRETKLSLLFLETFSQKLSELSPENFVEKYFVDGLDVALVVIGHDWRFGKGREGNPDLLKEFGRQYGFEVVVVPPVLLGQLRVSSSGLREALRSGDLEVASKLLGQNYSLIGRVRHGKKRGRELGYPTANLTFQRKILPRDGVYAAVANIDGRQYPAAINIGLRPTFGETERVVEAYIITGEVLNLYGRHLAVEFLGRLRDEVKFESAEALRQQIALDVEEVKRAVGNREVV